MNISWQALASKVASGWAFCALLVAVTDSAQASIVTTFNVNQAFVDNETAGPVNPNPPYAYGYTSNPTVLTNFSMAGLVHTTGSGFGSQPAFQGYYYPNNVIVPAIVGNVTASTASTGFATLLAGQLLLHPGGTTSNGFDPPYSDADLRYTATTTSAYNISGVYSRLDVGGTDVNIYINGANVFTAQLTSSTPSAAFNLNLSLNAGDLVDFVVGPGSDGVINNDSTGLFANILATPEPSSLVSLGIAGLLGLGFARRRLAAKRFA